MANQNNFNVSLELYEKYCPRKNNPDFAYSITTAVNNGVPTNVIEKICENSDNLSVCASRLYAFRFGIKNYNNIYTFDDINNEIRKEEQNKIFSESYNSIIEKLEDLETKINAIDEKCINKIDNDTNPVDLSVLENLDFEKFISSFREQQEAISTFKDEIINHFSTNDNKISECLVAVATLAKCEATSFEQLSLLKKYIENEVVSRVDNSLDSFLNDFMFKQEKLFNKVFTNNKGIFKSLFFKPKNNFDKENVLEETIDSNNDQDVKSNELEIDNNEGVEEDENLKKYKEVVDRINSSSEQCDIYDIFDLIRTGVFDDEQVKAINKGFELNLSPVNILEYAKPDNSAETMFQLISLITTISKNDSNKRKSASISTNERENKYKQNKED